MRIPLLGAATVESRLLVVEFHFGAQFGPRFGSRCWGVVVPGGAEVSYATRRPVRAQCQTLHPTLWIPGGDLRVHPCGAMSSRSGGRFRS